ncbi:MAG: hypothetical protein NUV44_07480 [Candidatus Scalindua sp.]|nr:hypothetical protein [Candidatus Scalindua sp.]
MVGEDEVASYIGNLGFKIIERDAILRETDNSATYPEFCYVLAQKPY